MKGKRRKKKKKKRLVMCSTLDADEKKFQNR